MHVVKFYYGISKYSSIHTKSKFGIIKIWMFLNEVSYAHQGCTYLVKNTVIVWNIITV